MKLYGLLSAAATLFSSSCYGIFEEQAGERDWLIENTGVVHKALYTDSSIFSASENGIIAKIDIKTGVAEWRVFLPDKSTVKAIIINGSKLFILSQQRTDPSQFGLLSSLDVITGQLNWDVALPYSSSSSIDIAPVSSSSTSLYLSDIAYDAGHKRLNVVHGNCLYFIDTEDGGKVEWFWNADGNFVLSRLLSYPSVSTVSESKNDSEAIALGCYIKKDDATVCSNTAIVSATHSQQRIKMTLYRTMSTSTSPQSLQSSLRAGTSMSDDKLSANDRGKSDNIIIGLTTVTGDSSGSSEVSVLHMGTNTTHKLALSSALSSQVTESFLILSRDNVNEPISGSDDVFLPAIKSCTSTSCDLYTVVSASNGSSNNHKREASTYVLNSILSCQGKSFAQVGLLQHRQGTYMEAAKYITGELLSEESVSSVSDTKLHITSAVLVGRGGAVVLSQASVSLPHIAMTGLTYVSGGTSQLLLVTSSGLTFSLSFTVTSVASGAAVVAVEWIRDEGLSQVRQAVMIDKPFKQQSSSSAVASDGSDELEEMPDFLTRWRMQLNELTEFATYLVTGILDLPETVQQHADNAVKSLASLQKVALNRILLATGDTTAVMEAEETPRVRSERRRRQQLVNRQARQKHFLAHGSGSHSASVSGSEEDALKRTQDRKFGFSKIIVCVTGADESLFDPLTSSLSSSGGTDRTGSQSALRVVGVDSQHGDIVWSLEPTLQLPTVESQSVTAKAATMQWVKLVSSHIHHTATLSLIMSMSDGSLHVWHIDPTTGITTSGASNTSSSQQHQQQQCSNEKGNTCTTGTLLAGGSTYRVSLPSHSYSDVYATSIHSLPTHSFTYLLHTSSPSPSTTSDLLSVALLPLYTEPPHHQTSSSSLNSLLGGVYTHHMDINNGELVTYQIDTSTCNTDSSANGLLAQCAAVPVASARFDPNAERIVSVTYPQSSEKIDKRYTILGDDSVLLKYLNPHAALVVTVSPPTATSEPLYASISGTGKVRVPICRDSGYDDSTSSNRANTTATTQTQSLPPCQLHVSLVDTVSGKVLYRASHEPATGPVHATMFENTIAYSYWNAQLKRAELSTVGLFEGIIDKYGLTPFASHASAAAAAVYTTGGSVPGVEEGGVATSDTASEGGAGVYNAFSAQTPLAAQKTYILPRTVTALAHTESARGIANKVLLLSLAPGQLYAVDMRQVHPRRPLAAPSKPEQEEGLTQYNPFVSFQSPQSVTLDAVVRGATQVISTPTRLESTTLIFSFGGTDVYLARSSQASGGFDLLASDFNHSFLVLILVALGVVAFTIRRLAIAKQLKQAWK